MCHVASHVLTVGDLNFFVQLQEKDNMSSSLCMWCMSHPHDWKLHPLSECEFWMVQKIKKQNQQVDAGVLK